MSTTMPGFHAESALRRVGTSYELSIDIAYRPATNGVIPEGTRPPAGADPFWDPDYLWTCVAVDRNTVMCHFVLKQQ